MHMVLRVELANVPGAQSLRDRRGLVSTTNNALRSNRTRKRKQPGARKSGQIRSRHSLLHCRNGLNAAQPSTHVEEVQRLQDTPVYLLGIARS